MITNDFSNESENVVRIPRGSFADDLRKIREYDSMVQAVKKAQEVFDKKNKELSEAHDTIRNLNDSQGNTTTKNLCDLVLTLANQFSYNLDLIIDKNKRAIEGYMYALVDALHMVSDLQRSSKITDQIDEAKEEINKAHERYLIKKSNQNNDTYSCCGTEYRDT